ncbi:penicillin-binding transpeptidase domain-containing protein [Klugiella xanthotipulae]|uniref:Cell elongation-specific peptidoglycan D,D-transpeptidase n=1 Tax=Klugiella xanthotipulae TaxID=244735 RepID=A0A543I6V4_9MICO|nr:penicillin-binding transpeptidase domain-containing protein [Klugiella xanthotipulae]TQM66333.1 cell elongation-specific peptidoglycan D,D-transpeptidase [Klugiella xanthotipulae]
MNKQLKRVSILIFLMFVALMTSTSIIQVFQADNLAADPRNKRTLYDSFDVERGAILVNGVPVAQSMPTGDNYKFQREYPQGDLYAAVTGYYTIDQGTTGIESSMNSELSGTSSSQFLDKINRIVTGQPPQGASVELTLDPVVQQAARDALGTLQGAVVAMRPKTGEILAMVSTPTYDPNLMTSHDSAEVIANYKALLADPAKPLDNRAITGSLNPPGSTFKLVVAAAALESGNYTPESTFANTGGYQLPGSSSVVRNSWRGTCGSGPTTTLLLGLTMSCNTPFAELAATMGNTDLHAQAEKFGFGQDLGIPTKVTPSIFPRTQDSARTALSGIGQADVRATPLQMAMVSAAIANDGKLMKPQLVQRVVAPNLSTISEFEPEVFSEPISSATAETLTEMMVNVVSAPNGSARTATIDGVRVAGKTGTAENGTVAPYTLWFTGFAPADDPEVVVAVVVEDGGGLGQNGTSEGIAAPIGKKVIEAVLNQ